MTTIAYRDGYLAADSQVTDSDIIRQMPCQKIYHPEEGEYWELMGQRVLGFGFAGNLAALPFVKDVLSAGLDHRTKIEDTDHINAQIIAVTELGAVYLWVYSLNVPKGTDVSVINLLTGQYAIGSGSPFAMALMSVGASAEEAVKGAIKLDPYSGGDIVVWKIPEPVTVRSVRPVKEEKVEKYTLEEVKHLLDKHRPKPPEPVTPPPQQAEETNPQQVGQAVEA